MASIVRAGRHCAQASRYVGRRFAMEATKVAGGAAKAQDDPVKQMFMKKLKQYLDKREELKKVKIVIDPDDPKAVKDYAENMEKIKKKIGERTQAEEYEWMMKSLWSRSESVREYHSRFVELRNELNIPDPQGVDQAMLESLDKVEKQIGRPILKTDKEGMKLFYEVSGAAMERLGIHEKDAAKYEKEMILDNAKVELTMMRDAARKNIDFYRKRDGIEEDIDVKKDIDIRNCL